MFTAHYIPPDFGATRVYLFISLNKGRALLFSRLYSWTATKETQSAEITDKAYDLT